MSDIGPDVAASQELIITPQQNIHGIELRNTNDGITEVYQAFRPTRNTEGITIGVSVDYVDSEGDSEGIVEGSPNIVGLNVPRGRRRQFSYTAANGSDNQVSGRLHRLRTGSVYTKETDAAEREPDEEALYPRHTIRIPMSDVESLELFLGTLDLSTNGDVEPRRDDPEVLAEGRTLLTEGRGLTLPLDRAGRRWRTLDVRSTAGGGGFANVRVTLDSDAEQDQQTRDNTFVRVEITSESEDMGTTIRAGKTRRLPVVAPIGTKLPEGCYPVGCLGAIGAVALTGALAYGAYALYEELKDIDIDLPEINIDLPNLGWPDWLHWPHIDWFDENASKEFYYPPAITTCELESVETNVNFTDAFLNMTPDEVTDRLQAFGLSREDLQLAAELHTALSLIAGEEPNEAELAWLNAIAEDAELTGISDADTVPSEAYVGFSGNFDCIVRVWGKITGQFSEERDISVYQLENFIYANSDGDIPPETVSALARLAAALSSTPYQEGPANPTTGDLYDSLTDFSQTPVGTPATAAGN